jgi:hypothetical protein
VAAAALLSPTSAVYLVGVMSLAGFMAFQGKAPARLLGLAALLFTATSFYDPIENVVLHARSFYAAYKVADVLDGKFRVLYHGTTAHGGERIADGGGRPIAGRPEPLTYYYNGGPLADGIQTVRGRAGGTLDRVAVIGLGIGSLSCSAGPSEAWTFYEIDPMDVAIARNRALFRSMSLCAPKAPVVIGDGRLTLRQAKPGFNLLILDVFSSDSVPLHMLTREAFGLYKSKLAPHGVIAINISNKNMELKDAVAASAAANGMVTAVNLDRSPDRSKLTLRYPAEIALVARSSDMRALKLKPDWQIVHLPAQTPVWTDDHSDVLSAILLKMRR